LTVDRSTAPRICALNMRILAFVLLVVTVWLLQLGSRADAQTRACAARCRIVFENTLDTTCLCNVEHPICDRRDCHRRARTDFPESVCDKCPTFAGHCTITHECVDRFRAVRARADERCERSFKTQLVRVCGRDGARFCLKAARVARRGCLKSCRHRSGVNPTPNIQCTEASPEGESSTTCLTSSLDDGSEDGCVRRFVGDCYDECDDRCEGDRVALALCRRGCRNASCGRLRKSCGENVDCEITTTSTSTSTTTTIASTTTTVSPATK